MPKTCFCWRCKTDIPFLTEAEWNEVRPLLELDVEAIKQHRAASGTGVSEAMANFRSQACEKYFEITGFVETNINALWHHRLGLYGRECPACGHLFRTPKAAFCASCGWRPGDIRIDWREHPDCDSVYSSIFRQAEAPGWHGTNLDAINDSWVTGGICSLGPPFRFCFRGAAANLPVDRSFIDAVHAIAADSVEENGGLLQVG